MNKLEEVLSNYHIEEGGDVIIEDIEDLVKKEMPGYDITVWDEDETNFGQSVGDTIQATVRGKMVEDMQTFEWCSEDCCCYVYVVAIKIKEN